MMFIARVYRLAWREFKILALDKRLLFIVLFMPVLYSSIFGTLYLQKRVTRIPTHFIDNDHTKLSRSVREAVGTSETFKIVRDDGTIEDFKQETWRDQAFACIVVPQGFQDDVKHGRPARILTLVDGSNLLISNTIRGGIAEIGGTFSVGVQMKRLSMRGTPSQNALGSSVPIEAATRVLYNPTFSYSGFVLTGLIGAVIQQITLLGVALAFAREREKKLFGEVLKITSSPFEVILAKAILYSVFGMFSSYITFLVGFKYFGINLVGSMGLVMSVVCLFIVAIVALGICISVFCKDLVFATELLMLLSLPSFLLSGFTWPQFAMPKLTYIVSQFLPLTHLVMPLRAVLIEGAGIEAIRPHLTWMWGLMGLSYFLAYVVVWRLMRAEKKKLPGASDMEAENRAVMNAGAAASEEIAFPVEA